MARLPFARRLLKALHPEGIPAFGARLYNAMSGTRIFQRSYDLTAEDILAYCARGKILDIGTGPGRLLLSLHRRSPQLELVGIDLSQAMVRKAEGHIRAAGFAESIRVEQADAKHLPFDDQSFDTVVSTGSVHHWKTPEQAIDEVYRVLKPGGWALLYDVAADTPKEVLTQCAADFGRVGVFLLWLHSFEEPFYTRDALEGLGTASRFTNVSTAWVGVLCRLAMRKPVP
ncbi:MAG: class I SAM-dependent methyltransferase [Thermodesulfobacteriota bacterium]